MNGRRSRADLIIERLAIAAFLLFLTVRTFDGPIRFWLFNKDLIWVIYVPTFILLGAVLTKVFVKTSMTKLRVRKTIVVIIGLSVAALLLGLINLENQVQVFLGIYVFVPFLFGLTMAPEIAANLRGLYLYFLFAFVASVIGVFLDYRLDLPWSGFQYELAGVVIEGTRKWTTFGVERVAGFARASFEVGSIILISSLFSVSFVKSWLLKLIMWLVGFAAIALTTAKGIVAAYLALTLLILARRLKMSAILRISPYLVAATVICIPVYAWTHPVSLNLTNDLYRFLLASFEDRMTRVWPASYELVAKYGIDFLGRGLGGIGSPQARFEPLISSPGDNIFVYLFGIVGVFAAPLLFGVAYMTSRYATSRRVEGWLFYLLGVGALVYGLVTNVIENSWMGLFLGMVVGGLGSMGFFEYSENPYNCKHMKKPAREHSIRQSA